MSIDAADRRDGIPPELNRRQRLLWGVYDFAAGHGLEIGPLHQPAVPRDHADVTYVDVFDRATLQANYSHDPNVPPDQIPEIDFVLLDGDRVRSIPETVGEEAVFDWVMASHVIEHVPDVIGWLEQIATVTKDGGDLVLAVPDRRYCFDLHRPGTSVGQMIQAHELGDTVPSVRAVYDDSRGHASVRAPMIWSNNPVGYENRIYSLETALERTERARGGVYIDSHVWLFTPGTLLEQLIELRTIGLSDWKVSHLAPTKHNELEFYAVLTRLPRDRSAWTPELFAGEPEVGRMPDWVAEAHELARDLERTRVELAASQKALSRSDKQLRTVRAREQRRLGVRLRNRLRRSPAGPLLARAVRAARGR